MCVCPIIPRCLCDICGHLWPHQNHRLEVRLGKFHRDPNHRQWGMGIFLVYMVMNKLVGKSENPKISQEALGRNLPQIYTDSVHLVTFGDSTENWILKNSSQLQTNPPRFLRHEIGNAPARAFSSSSSCPCSKSSLNQWCCWFRVGIFMEKGTDIYLKFEKTDTQNEPRINFPKCHSWNLC